MSNRGTRNRGTRSNNVQKPKTPSPETEEKRPDLAEAPLSQESGAKEAEKEVTSPGPVQGTQGKYAWRDHEGPLVQPPKEAPPLPEIHAREAKRKAYNEMTPPCPTCKSRNTVATSTQDDGYTYVQYRICRNPVCRRRFSIRRTRKHP